MVVRLTALLAVVLAVLAGCSGGGGSTTGGTTAATQETRPEEVPEDAVAVVAGTPILKADFERLLKQAEAAVKAQGGEFPDVGTAEYEQLKRGAVDQLIQQAEFEKEVTALGLTVTDQEVADRLEQLKEQFYQGDDAKYQDELAQAGLTEEDVSAIVRSNLLAEKLRAEVTKEVTVTDEEVTTYYDENKDRFTTPATREVAHILVEEKAKADELYAKLENGADFAELAKKNSTDESSAENGGRLPEPARQDGSLVPEFEKVAFELPTGTVSEPVKTQYGWHLIKALEDTKPEVVTQFDQVKEDIRDQLLQERKNEVMSDWVAEIRAKYAGEIAYAVGFEPVGDTAAATTR